MKKLSAILLTTSLMLSGCVSFPVSEEGITPPEEKIISERDFTITPISNENSNPDDWDVRWEIFSNEKSVDQFNRKEKIEFGHADNYFPFEGISTFRGNNYRNDATYGSANVIEGKLEKVWDHKIGSLGEWTGCGWTGQPLIVRWEEETKQIMNIYPEKKAVENLVEVIYATLDGNIYFYDLQDGKPTRDKLNVGMTFKGTGTLDPRGYPIMYIGSGIESGSKSQRMYAIDLIENKVIYEQSGSDPDALRNWAAFDSSPLIDAETDTLIWPGENGILYTLKLNTIYDKESKKITINPENIAKCRYKTEQTDKGRWEGYESSCVIVGSHAYLTENSGMMFCVDLNSMNLVWGQNVVDDTNSSPVFEWKENGEGAIYTANALRWTAQGSRGSTFIYKIDAKNGNVLWSKEYDCVRNEDRSGGVQSSPAIGKKYTDLEDLIFYNIASTPSGYRGKLLAMDKETGETVWEHEMKSYTWSSPVAVYNADGKGYIVICDFSGNVKLLDGADGTLLSTVDIGSNVEASPAVFEDTLVVGTRGCRIYGVKIK